MVMKVDLVNQMEVPVFRLDNVLSSERRKKIITDAEKIGLGDTEYWYEANRGLKKLPGRQTRNDLHRIEDFRWLVREFRGIAEEILKRKLVIDGAWVNWTNGKKRDICWHSHDHDYALVYYVKVFPMFSNGTIFKNKNGEKVFYKANQNSLLLFPARIEHTAPTSPLRFGRYTLALDLDYN